MDDGRELVRGGQGRSAAELEDDAMGGLAVLAWVLAAALIVGVVASIMLWVTG